MDLLQRGAPRDAQAAPASKQDYRGDSPRPLPLPSLKGWPCRLRADRVCPHRSRCPTSGSTRAVPWATACSTSLASVSTASLAPRESPHPAHCPLGGLRGPPGARLMAIFLHLEELLQKPSVDPGKETQQCLGPPESRNGIAHGPTATPTWASSIPSPTCHPLGPRGPQAAFSQSLGRWLYELQNQHLEPQASSPSAREPGPPGASNPASVDTQEIQGPDTQAPQHPGPQGAATRPPRHRCGPQIGPPGSCGHSSLGPRAQGREDRTGSGSAAALPPFSDISLDVDTARRGKVKRSHGDKVKLCWLAHDGRAGRRARLGAMGPTVWGAHLQAARLGQGGVT